MYSFFHAPGVHVEFLILTADILIRVAPVSPFVMIPSKSGGKPHRIIGSRDARRGPRVKQPS